MSESDELETQVLSFTVPGRVASNNRTTRNFARGAVKSAEARGYQSRVFQIAFAAVATCGWKQPEACAVTIAAFNVRLDADNICKNCLDGMIGVVYDDDRRVVDLRVTKYVDNDGERIYVAVKPCAPLVRAKKRKAIVRGRAA